MCDKLLLLGKEARRQPVHEREGGSRPVVRTNEMSNARDTGSRGDKKSYQMIMVLRTAS